MIESITNSAKVQEGLIQLKPSSGFKALPSVNSTVQVNVLEKIGSNYRLLINGSVYQSNLPVTTEKGEEFLAKVMSHQPLTLGLDNFAKFGQLDAQSASLLLSKLKIAETDLTKTLLEKVVSSKKPLLKSKIDRLIEYAENMDIKIDDVLMQLLISAVWNLSEDKLKETKNIFEEVFDISFEELSKQIFALINKSNELNLSQGYYDLVNDSFILDAENFEQQLNISAVKDKSERFLNLIQFIYENESQLNLDNSANDVLSELRTFSLKYVLQKALYGKFEIYPEFAILKRKGKLELVNFRLEKNDGNSYRVISKIDLDKDDSFFIQGLFTNEKFIGEAIVNNKIDELVKNQLNVLNKKISQILKIVADVKGKIKNITTLVEGDSIITHQPINVNI